MSGSRRVSGPLPPAPAAVGLLAFAVAVAAVAVVGSWSAASASAEYAYLRQPDFAPPAWIFGPVWTLLYSLIAIAGWLVWRQVGGLRAERWGFACYAAQLVLTAVWTPLFFTAGRYGLAFADIVLLWMSIIATVLLFARRHRLAAALLLPYLAWVTFAGVLTASIWLMNS